MENTEEGGVYAFASANGFEKESIVHDRQFAQKLDDQDPLSSFRSKFFIPTSHSIQKEPFDKSTLPERDCIYMCGNSLGLEPRNIKKYVNEELDSWAALGVEGHLCSSRPWLTIDEFVHKQMAKVVGANPEEVVVMNSLTVNLHLMMVPFYRPTKERYKILFEAGSFPSDLYAYQSQAHFHDLDPEDACVQLKPREGEYCLRTEDIVSFIRSNGSSIAVVVLSGLQYFTGQYFDLHLITLEAQKQGCKVGFDLAHAVGNVPLKLHDWGVDFAVWCSYKYLNAGPGSIGGCFVHQKHATDSSLKRFTGWWGHDLQSRFSMDAPWSAIPGAFGFRLSNPPVLCVVSLLASLELFEEAGMDRLRKKSELLTEYLEILIKKHLDDKVEIITPSNKNERGCQLSLMFKGNARAREVSERLKKKGVVCDVRKDQLIRVAPAPFYNSFCDVFDFVQILSDVLNS